ncbi:MAG TPA: metal ABC transporter permease [Soehngenia sp.]|jgi:ABC-type Mn2+/Zn2+ transport systems, permease components|nr:metal ABC transporter permease [Soehngenia sp.]
MNIIETISEAMSFVFMQRAMVVGIFIAVVSSILGSFLVLKRYSLIGDGLAHVSFATVALALSLGLSPLLISLPIVTLASIVIMKLNEKASLNGDASIGLVSSFSIALGVIIASKAKGFNVDINSYLFGSILAIDKVDSYISVIMSIVMVIIVYIFYQDLLAVTFDEEFSKVSGVNTTLINYLLSVLTSITIVLGMRVLGTLLISSLIIFPTITSMQIAKSFKSLLVIGICTAIFSMIIGLIGSYIFNIPSGPSIVITNTFVFLCFYAIGKLIKR